MPANKWTEADTAASMAEGWLLAYVDAVGSGVRHEIQRYDAMDPAPAFDSDKDAFTYVRLKALKGSELHQRALAICRNDENAKA